MFTALRQFTARLRAFFTTPDLDGDFEQELEVHVAMLTEEQIHGGMTPEEARRSALIRVGAGSSIKEQHREARGLPWLDDLRSDLRHSIRALRRSPGFTTVALLTLALGIGANTAIFSIVNAVILRSLSYVQPERLVHLSTQTPSLGLTRFPLSASEYIDFREISQSFEAIGAYTTAEVNFAADDRALRVRSAAVDEHLLKALRVEPARGRLFKSGETDAIGYQQPGQPSPQPPPIVLLSHELWQSAFHGRPAIGKFVEVHGRLREIIGIMPPGVDVMDNRTEIWLPLGLSHENRQSQQHFWFLIGRLKDGVSLQAAQLELKTLTEHWAARVGNKRHAFIPLGQKDAHFLEMTPLHDEVIGSASRAIWVLQAAVGLILLIACVNLANLHLARAEVRHREFAVRAALGASRTRLFRQFVAEGLLVSVAGGAVGLILAWVGLRVLMQTYPDALPRTSRLSIDVPVLVLTLVVAAATGVVFGLAPMMHTRVKRLTAALNEGGLRGSTVTRHVIRRGLVTTQVALAVVLVLAAALLIRTVSNLTAIDGGFDRSRLVTFQMTLPNFRYPDPADRSQFFQTLLSALATVPGVETVTAMSGLPLNRPLNPRDMQLRQVAAADRPSGHTAEYLQAVMSGYFETMEIPIVRGRGFQPHDAASAGLVTVVNETLAKTFWTGQDPIGRQIRPCCGDRIPWFTVIGVAKDVKQQGVDQPTRSEFYFLVEQTGRVSAYWMFGTGAPGTMNVILRTTLPPAALSQTIHRTVRDVDLAIPIVRLRSMEEVFAESIRLPRLLAQLLSGFATFALLLAAIGIYGVLAYMVAARRREMGIRMALGARRTTVLAQVLKQGLLLVGIGIIAGATCAFGLNQWLTSLLYGVTPTDTSTFVTAILTILLASIIACGVPAWRASRLDPNVALRVE